MTQLLLLHSDPSPATSLILSHRINAILDGVSVSLEQALDLTEDLVQRVKAQLGQVLDGIILEISIPTRSPKADWLKKTVETLPNTSLRERILMIGVHPFEQLRNLYRDNSLDTSLLETIPYYNSMPRKEPGVAYHDDPLANFLLQLHQEENID